MGGYVKLQSGDQERYLRLQRFLLAVMTSSAQNDKLERIMYRDQTVFEQNVEQRREVNARCMQHFYEDVMPSKIWRDFGALSRVSRMNCGQSAVSVKAAAALRGGSIIVDCYDLAKAVAKLWLSYTAS